MKNTESVWVKWRLFLTVALSFLPGLIPLFYLSTDGTMPVLANTFGFIGAVLLWWQAIIGIRQVAIHLGLDRQSLIRWHILLGTYGILSIALHPVLEMFVYQSNISFLVVPSFVTTAATFITLGRIAAIGFIIIWITSAAVKKLLKYRIWQYTHLLTYPVTFLVFVHAFFIGTYLNAYPVIMYWWILLTGSFIFAMLYRFTAPWFVEKRYTLIAKETFPGNVNMYRFKPSTSRRIQPKTGQYIYLRIHNFGEAHPFTVLRYNDTGEIELGIKTFGPFTKSLESVSIGSQMRLDGPYGNFTQENKHATYKVMIAGGIGITPFVRLVDQSKSEQTYLVNCVRTPATAVWRDEFKKKLNKNYIEICSDEKVAPTGSYCGFISAEILQSAIPAQVIKEGAFYICGPQGMMTAVQNILKSIGVANERIFIERFAI